MINYYDKFHSRSNDDASKSIENLVTFLAHYKQKISALQVEEEKKRILMQSIILAQYIQTMPLIFREKRNNVYLKQKSKANQDVNDSKTKILPLSKLGMNYKEVWFRVLSCLIPYLESERYMTFLGSLDNANEMLKVIVENVNLHKDGYNVLLDIVKNSFNITSSNRRHNVEIEDVVRAVRECNDISEVARNRLAFILFNEWYQLQNIAGISYQKG
jgi:hypothetical protein